MVIPCADAYHPSLYIEKLLFTVFVYPTYQSPFRAIIQYPFRSKVQHREEKISEERKSNKNTLILS